MPFAYQRNVHFPDTDAVGMVFFGRYLSICHETYEESLSTAGVPLGYFFADHESVIPVAKREASYWRPCLRRPLAHRSVTGSALRA